MYEFTFNNKKYKVKDELWDIHTHIYPVKPVDVLFNNVLAIFGSEFDSEDIEQLILQESNFERLQYYANPILMFSSCATEKTYEYNPV